MTIPYEIIIGDPLSKEEQRGIEKILSSTFLEVDAIYNKWNPESELSQLNALPEKTEMTLSTQLALFLQKTALFVALDPRFDPTVEPLQRLWQKRLERNNTPSVDELNQIKKVVGWDNLIFQNKTICKKYSATSLDLGSIAKGYLVDLIVTRLQQIGYRSIFVEWGGEIRTVGAHPDKRAWTVGITHITTLTDRKLIKTIQLTDKAVATSGDYLQNWTVKNKKYTHVVNAKTRTIKEVTDHSIASTTVLADNCMTADALATMLFLCDDLEDGKALIKKCKERFPDTDYLLCLQDGSYYATFDDQ